MGDTHAGPRRNDRALLHLVAHGPARELIEAATGLAGDRRATVLARAEDCFVGDASPYSVTIELDASNDPAAIAEPAVGLLEPLDGLFDPSASMALVGTDVVFIEPPVPPSGFRFQYLMRRRHDYTHDAYLRRYEEVHSSFGLRTPNLEGYVQHHVDLERSAALAEATGLGDPACDSMSELHLASVEHFLEGVVANPQIGREAVEDEERFLDRRVSFGFCHRVLKG